MTSARMSPHYWGFRKIQFPVNLQERLGLSMEKTNGSKSRIIILQRLSTKSNYHKQSADWAILFEFFVMQKISHVFYHIKKNSKVVSWVMNFKLTIGNHWKKHIKNINKWLNKCSTMVQSCCLKFIHSNHNKGLYTLYSVHVAFLSFPNICSIFMICESQLL